MEEHSHRSAGVRPPGMFSGKNGSVYSLQLTFLFYIGTNLGTIPELPLTWRRDGPFATLSCHD
jgi:hypothetical protein